MKYLITERQLKLIKEDEDKILKLDFDFFNDNWDVLQKFLERRGNPPYIIIGDLDLIETDIKTLGSLVGVEGSLHLSFNETIKDLGNIQSVEGDLDLTGAKIESLGNLQSVGGDLFLQSTIVTSLGNLQSVGGDLYLRNTPLSKTTTEEEIRNQVEVGGDIYL